MTGPYIDKPHEIIYTRLDEHEGLKLAAVLAVALSVSACANNRIFGGGQSDAMANAATPGSQQDFVVNVGDRHIGRLACHCSSPDHSHGSMAQRSVGIGCVAADCILRPRCARHGPRPEPEPAAARMGGRRLRGDAGVPRGGAHARRPRRRAARRAADHALNTERTMADFTNAELMAAAIARELRDDDFAAVGTASHIPVCALRLAQRTHAPDIVGVGDAGGLHLLDRAAAILMHLLYNNLYRLFLIFHLSLIILF